MHERIKLASRIFISLACFVVVFSIVDYNDVVKLAGEVKSEIIVQVLLVMLAGHIGSGLRFHFILNKLGKKISRKESLKAGFVALWFNQILPTGMGGDVVRAFMLAKSCGRARIVLAAFQDRILGLMMMILMMLCFMPIALAGKVSTETIVITSIIAAAGLAAGFLPIYISRSLCAKFGNKYLYKACRFFAMLGYALRRIVEPACAYKLLSYLVISLFPYIIFIAILGDAFGLTMTMLEYTALVPLMFIAMQFPITVGGWGARELAALYIFSIMGMSEEIAVTISVLFGFSMLITSIPGNFFWIQRRHNASSAAA